MASILIVDDEEEIRVVLETLLKRAGFDIHIATDGDLAIKMYRESPTDLVIIDIIMPNKNGVDAIRALREEFPDVKIIAVSGGGQTGVLSYKPVSLQTTVFLSAAESAVADAVLPKPFSTKELLAVIESLME